VNGRNTSRPHAVELHMHCSHTRPPPTTRRGSLSSGAGLVGHPTGLARLWPVRRLVRNFVSSISRGGEVLTSISSLHCSNE
jgi:hypothetical protein